MEEKTNTDIDKDIDKAKEIFVACADLKLVYFFGSKARGEAGPMSDYDFAVYFDEKDTQKVFDLRMVLQEKIKIALGTEKVDIVAIDAIEAPEMKYNIIKDGKIIFEREPYKVLLEPKILNEYFDFRSFLLRNNLTRA